VAVRGGGSCSSPQHRRFPEDPDCRRGRCGEDSGPRWAGGRGSARVDRAFARHRSVEAEPFGQIVAGDAVLGQDSLELVAVNIDHCA
jgi:hypothetical protein